MNHSATYTLTRGDEDFELEVEYSTSPYDPGNTYGLPEDCEPPSGGEIEEMTVTLAGETAEFPLTDAEMAALEKWLYENTDYSDDGGDYDY